MLELVQLYIERNDNNNAKKYIRDCLKMTKDHHLFYQHALCQLYAAHVQVILNLSQTAIRVKSGGFIKVLTTFW